tara:strand:- start:594 stop:2894 length:2301 start_codon:yes stop_codon:yes gene_type:complete
VKKCFICIKVILIFSLFFSSENVFAQLGFCQGNSGDPIFLETFGTGTTDSLLPAGTTTYNYANGGEPNDGRYTVTSNTNYFDWFNAQDHTPSDSNGRMLLVNSASAAGEFYRTTINGLCENTSYEFSSWILNLTPANGFCGAGAIPVNVRFEIWDNTDTNLLASGDTGNIGSTFSPNWQQYALVFQTTVNQTSVILKMINNGSGGCGNDLAIDDIVFKSCGDFIEVGNTNSNDSVSLCSTSAPYDTTLTAIPDNAVFSSHFYQWQESFDNMAWIDITGETNETLIVSDVTSTTYYRTKVAEFASNLNNNDCNTFSNVFEIIITQAPTQPTLECWETAIFDDTLCDWVVSGTQPTQPTGLECWETASFNSTICTWDITGTQPIQPILECWETANFNDSTCLWEVSGNQPAQPSGLECWETASFNSTICAWDITGTQPIQPILECWETANFNDSTCLWEVSGNQPAQPTGLECWESTSFNVTTCSWEIVGTQPTQSTSLECWETTTFNGNTCLWEISGVQPQEPTDLECWQVAIFNDESCSWEISGEQIIDFEEEFFTICEGEDIALQASTTIINAAYLWNTGETTASIIVNTVGIYSVVTTDGCSAIEKTIIAEQSVSPVLESIQSDGSNILVFTSNTGNFLYSIDGINYQTSNIFFNVDGGYYDVYIKSADCDDILITSYIHFHIPKFITPNNDSVNDTFKLSGLEFYSSSEVYIFDRFGKLLFSAKNRSVNWTGRYNNNPLPTSDYWYVIIVEGQEFRGHFTLKR